VSDVCYDYYSRPITESNTTDGDWQVANPIDSVTGLWYDPESTIGQGADWYELLQQLVQHGYESALKAPTDKHPLLLSERSYTPPAIRQQVLECAFEELDVPAFFLAKDAVLACYACGRTTATVVDVGYSGTTVTPVYEGYVELKGVRRSPAGVKELDRAILASLDKLHPKGVVKPTYQVKGTANRHALIYVAARLEIAKECREMGAGAAVNTTSNSGSATFHVPHKSFELPDGTVVDVPSADRFAAANLVLGNDEQSLQRREKLLQEQREQLGNYIATANQDEEGDEEDNDNDIHVEDKEEQYSEAAAAGISKRRTNKRSGGGGANNKKAAPVKRAFSNHHLQKACVGYLQTLQSDMLTASPVANMVCDAAYRCDRDQQAALMGNVVLTGGGTCLGPTEQAVPDYLREKIESIIHQHTPGWRVKVLAPGMQERSVGSWLGGSILASLGTFHDMWITKAEYDEWGPAIVNRKCP